MGNYDDDIDNMDYDLPEDLLVPATEFSTHKGRHPPPQVVSQGADPRVKEAAKKWTCLYPVYIDQSKSWHEGRRVAKHLATKDPAAMYMADAIQRLGLAAMVEPDRRHPRDAFTFGRIKVQLRTPQGVPINPLYANKRALLIKIASMLPECAEALNQSDPRLAAIAAASRSELSKNVQDIAQTKPQKNAAIAGPSQSVSENTSSASKESAAPLPSSKSSKKKRR
ncbi:hypothetical protein BASA61_004034 [Batrachochytrium salamandrivorans]|nr:hypothetical protein BASA61_004034 [Batrachochytrium salamandrivorans]